MGSWQTLRQRFPWPDARPTTQRLVHGWTTETAWPTLLDRLPRDGIVLEIGAWTGKTSLHILERPALRLVAVDIWTDRPTVLDTYWPSWRAEKTMVPGDTPKSLYQTNLWDHRGRVVCVQGDSVAGMLAVAACGVRPDLVYIDADHGRAAVSRDVTVAVECFPDALMSGHDYQNNDGSLDGPVAHAVNQYAQEHGLTVQHIGKVWWYDK